MKKALYIAIFAALVAAISCGGNSNKKGKADGNVNPEQSSEVAATQMETNAEVVFAKEEPKAQSKEWYEQDFSMTYKQYVAGASMSRTYARKGTLLSAWWKAAVPRPFAYVLTLPARSIKLVTLAELIKKCVSALASKVWMKQSGIS